MSLLDGHQVTDSQYQQSANESAQPELALQQQPFSPDDPPAIQTPKLDEGWHLL